MKNYKLYNQPLTKTHKTFSKKTFKKFASLKKRRTFAPAKEDSNASGAERTTRTLT
ncbi:hypothetical protein [Capnocytophaga sp. oral taxon 412]|uniref:hypothetical protein n=1 Tax=Capnocytophaga sp. oral taxon 412 TaxID=712218 RepID=UPI0018DBE090|nr:hypothetical protein [Capnocytophaga sp. oral taxon 412]